LTNQYSPNPEGKFRKRNVNMMGMSKKKSLAWVGSAGVGVISAG